MCLFPVEYFIIVGLLPVFHLDHYVFENYSPLECVDKFSHIMIVMLVMRRRLQSDMISALSLLFVVKLDSARMSPYAFEAVVKLRCKP